MKTCALFGFAAATTFCLAQPHYKQEWYRVHHNPYPENSFGVSVKIGPDGQPIVLGQIAFTSNGRLTYQTTKFDQDGNVVWRRQEIPRVHGIPTTMLMAANGDPIVVGTMTAPGPVFWGQFFASRYRNEDGAVLWRTLYHFPKLYGIGPNVKAATIDDAGDIYISGYISATGVTMKLNGDTGEVEWVEQYYRSGWQVRLYSIAALPRTIVSVGGGYFGFELEIPLALWHRPADGETWAETTFNAESKASFHRAIASLDGTCVVDGGFFGEVNGSFTILGQWIKYDPYTAEPVWTSTGMLNVGDGVIYEDNEGILWGIGNNYDFDQERGDGIIVKIDGHTGQFQFQHRHEPVTDQAGFGSGFVVDDRLFVIGYQNSIVTGRNGFVKTLDADTGKVLSIVTLDTGPRTINTLLPAALASDGAIYASGGCIPIGHQLYIVTAKFVPVERGDLDQNGCVDDRDLALLLENFGAESDRYDVDRFGVVDEADLAELLQNFGKGCRQ